MFDYNYELIVNGYRFTIGYTTTLQAMSQVLIRLLAILILASLDQNEEADKWLSDIVQFG
jgi:hypothetical protein